jgi:hypothetical protein
MAVSWVDNADSADAISAKGQQNAEIIVAVDISEGGLPLAQPALWSEVGEKGKQSKPIFMLLPGGRERTGDRLGDTVIVNKAGPATRDFGQGANAAIFVSDDAVAEISHGNKFDTTEGEG